METGGNSVALSPSYTRCGYNSHLARQCRAPSTVRTIDTEDTAAQNKNQIEERHISYSKKEKTSLFIRTQEGDRIELRFHRRQTARITANNDVTTLQANRDSRLRISVIGNLNTDEQAAIAAVLEQAASITHAFFDGRIDLAFDAAAELKIDGQQLAYAALRLKDKTAVTYAGTALPQADSGDPAPSVEPDEDIIATTHTSGHTAVSSRSTATTPDDAAAAAAQTETAELVEPSADTDAPAARSTTTNEAAPPATGNDAAVTSAVFFASILDFLTLLLDVFESPAAADPNDTPVSKPDGLVSFSLKVRILGSLLVQATADGSEAAADEQESTLSPLVAETLDNIAASGDARIPEAA